MAIPTPTALPTIGRGAVMAVTGPTTITCRIVSRTVPTVAATVMAALWGVTTRLPKGGLEQLKLCRAEQ